MFFLTFRHFVHNIELGYLTLLTSFPHHIHTRIILIFFILVGLLLRFVREAKGELHKANNFKSGESAVGKDLTRVSNYEGTCYTPE